MVAENRMGIAKLFALIVVLVIFIIVSIYGVVLWLVHGHRAWGTFVPAMVAVGFIYLSQRVFFDIYNN